MLTFKMEYASNHFTCALQWLIIRKSEGMQELYQHLNILGSSRILMEEKFHFTSPLDCHIQFPTVKEDPCSITFEASKPSGTRL